jgi:Flp pilus assembly protein TadG
MRIARGNRKGNALVEFAIGSSILIPCLAGTFQFGYGFYTYNRIESAIADGARYASLRTYRCLSVGDINKVKTAIRNVTVYGSPNPTNTSRRLVPELTVDRVAVDYRLNSLNIPLDVTVRANGVQINAVFARFTLRDKPRVTFPFIGRYAPEESEP